MATSTIKYDKPTKGFTKVNVPSAVSDQNNLYYCQVGKHVQLAGWISTKANTLSDPTTIIATGLPAPEINTTILFYDQNIHKVGGFYLESGATNMTISSGYNDTEFEGHVLNFVGSYIAITNNQV